MVRWVFRLLNLLRAPSIFEFFWHLLTRVTPLSESELYAASTVLGPSAIGYSSVRVAEGRLLRLIFKLNSQRAFTTFHTVNMPSSGGHSREHLDLLVHELVHVFQFEILGSVYIWQALRAQRTDGYDYGEPEQLREDRKNGKRYRDYNREQQGQIAQDYYGLVAYQNLATTDPMRQAYEPFITDLRRGDL